VQLTEQDFEAGYANVTGMVFATYRSEDGNKSMVARSYFESHPIMQWPVLEVNIALAVNQSAWISSPGRWLHKPEMYQSHCCTD
jgi:hypothetical protein